VCGAAVDVTAILASAPPLSLLVSSDTVVGDVLARVVQKFALPADTIDQLVIVEDEVRSPPRFATHSHVLAPPAADSVVSLSLSLSLSLWWQVGRAGSDRVLDPYESPLIAKLSWEAPHMRLRVAYRRDHVGPVDVR
jgi:hypothetical protein